jgi:hypothetical protein
MRFALDQPRGRRLGQNAATMRTTLLAATLLLALCLDAAAQSPSPAKPAMPTNHPPIGAGAQAKEPASPWADFAEYALTVKVPPKGEAGMWKIRAFADPSDVLVELDTPAAKGRNRGSILLVGGQHLAVKGLALEAGFELDPLDAAIVSLKLLTRLLDAAVPGGPASLKGRQSVTARDDKAPIVASTPTASSRLSSPWSLKGTVARVDANTVSYELEVEAPFGEKGETRARWSFSGTAAGSAGKRSLDDGMSLAGWTAYSIGPGTSGKSGHASLRFRATKLPGPFATLKDLRAAAARGG